MNTYIYWAELQTHWYIHNAVKQITYEIEYFPILKKQMSSSIVIAV